MKAKLTIYVTAQEIIDMALQNFKDRGNIDPGTPVLANVTIETDDGHSMILKGTEEAATVVMEFD